MDRAWMKRMSIGTIAALVLAGAATLTAGTALAQATPTTGVGAIVPLPKQMAAAAKEYLPGVVGDPVPAFTIDPALATLKAGTRTYKIVRGDKPGKTEQHVIAPDPKGASGTDWLYTVGDQTVMIDEVPGVSLSVVSEADRDHDALTRYTPPKPLLIGGMNAGDTKKMTLDVKVYDLKKPSDLEHEGKLDLTLTYVGAYKVTVPAGTFDAALIRWHFKGKIGPAKIDSIQARFVAPDVGMVAAAEKRDIAALLIYSDNTKVGRVLVQP